MNSATISDLPGLIDQSLGFDPQALRAKYLAERDQRLRIDGIAQYQEITEKFARFGHDPCVSPGFTRAPLSDEADVVVIGGGFGGLLAGARLRDPGVKDIRATRLYASASWHRRAGQHAASAWASPPCESAQSITNLD